MNSVAKQTPSLAQMPRQPKLEGVLRRKEIQDYIEKRFSPLLSKMKDRVRRVVKIVPVFIRDKRLTRFEFARVRE
ncbi:MAG: hypothetical protein QW275_03355 [Candidatus Anstonellaceae archaeon]